MWGSEIAAPGREHDDAAVVESRLAYLECRCVADDASLATQSVGANLLQSFGGAVFELWPLSAHTNTWFLPGWIAERYLLSRGRGEGSRRRI